jgi:hypothetical protein
MGIEIKRVLPEFLKASLSGELMRVVFPWWTTVENEGPSVTGPVLIQRKEIYWLAT